MTTREAEIRQYVSEAYTKAVAAPTAGCCGGMHPQQKGTVVKIAGYDGMQLSELPANAVENSFGCGNPLAFSEVKQGDTVVDLGSGAGIDLLIAARKTGPSGRVIGIDMTDAMIERTTNIAQAGVSGFVEVRKGLIEDMPVESGTVDWVISNCVINLSPEKSRVFAEIARVLKPGGRMLVSDIVVDGLPEELRRNQALYNSCVSGAISEKDYLAGLRKAGLTDVQVRTRHVYDDCQLEALIESEIVKPSTRKSGCGCGGGPGDVDVAQMASRASGKVASINVFALKP